MIINNVEVEFDASDSEQIAKMEDALNKMGAKEKEIKEMDSPNLSEMLRSLTEMLSGFFIDATGCDVLKGATSYKVAQECYYSFLAEIAKQKKEILAPYDTARIR